MKVERDPLIIYLSPVADSSGLTTATSSTNSLSYMCYGRDTLALDGHMHDLKFWFGPAGSSSLTET